MLKPLDTSNWKREDILREAQLQSAALARLGTWKRLAYSLVAIGFVLGLWGSSNGTMWAQVVAVICLVAGIPLSIVLTVGTSRGKQNVERMLEAAGVDVDELLRPRAKGEAFDRARGTEAKAASGADARAGADASHGAHDAGAQGDADAAARAPHHG